MTRKPIAYASLIAAMLALGACRAPFSEKTADIDWSGTPAAGTIAVSQPKMYRRASLINERREDLEWIKQLGNKPVTFAPEISREIEQVTAFAAALGLSFDPAKAASYRRTRETDEIRQEIDIEKLRLQLDQLKQDAGIVRKNFASQTEPVNTGVAQAEKGNAGTPPATGNNAGPAPISAAVEQLRTAIDKLSTSMTTLLNTQGQPVAKADTSAGVNPSDVFRDMSTYRDLLKAARNAASLDDLHDLGGSALIRLNFQAMVLPDREKSRVPGVVQMRIKPPVMDPKTMVGFYSDWLDYINARLLRQAAGGLPQDKDLLYSAVADNFDQARYYYSANSAKAGASASNCPGLILGEGRAPGQCASLVVAVPGFRGILLQEDAYSTLDRYIELFFRLMGNEEQDRLEFVANHKLILSDARHIVRDCGLPVDDPPPPGQSDSNAHRLFEALRIAQVRVAAGDVFARTARLAQQALRTRGIAPPPANREFQSITARAALARSFLLLFENAAYQRCPSKKIQDFRNWAPELYVPHGFENAVMENQRVAVYEIGPREQVQQVSSVSRIANNLSLAVSLASAIPAAGGGADAASNFSRQAVGKAAAIERIPSVLGYATQDEDENVSFGWVIAPKATFDPKGSVDLEQNPRTLDLSVDLSIPGWWRSFSIETITGWAMDPVAITRGRVSLPVSQDMTVPMDQTDADFDVITTRILRGRLHEFRQTNLDAKEFENQVVDACRSTSLYISGKNIWRATSVMIGGHLLDENTITVAPDMSGILLAVPALDGAVGDTQTTTLPLIVFTRYGVVKGDVRYVPKPRPAGCRPAPLPPQAGAADKPPASP